MKTRISDLSVGTRLGAGFGLVLLFLLALVLFCFRYLGVLERANADHHDHAQDVEMVARISFIGERADQVVARAIITGDAAEAKRNWPGVKALCQGRVDTLDTIVTSEKDKASATVVRHEFDGFIHIFEDSLLTGLESGSLTHERQIALKKKMDGHLKALKDPVRAIRTSLGEGMELSQAQFQAALHAMKAWMTGLALAALALGAALAFFLTSSIVSRLRRLTQIAQEVAQGKVEHTLERGSQDEIGQLFDAFAAMIEYLTHAAQTASLLAQGDLRTSVNPHSPQDHLNVNFAQMLKRWREDVETLQSNSHAMAGAAEEMSSVGSQLASHAEGSARQSQQMAEMTRSLSQSIHQVAAGAEEMSAGIRGVADNSAQTAHRANMAVEAVQRADVSVARLGEASSQVGQVVGVINTIAEQTKLLALNATIEAARAGEAGKGFAVVAIEVKDLAKKTAEATSEISGMIAAIRQEIDQAIASISGVGVVVDEIAGLSQSIAGAIREQSAATEEIVRSVNEGSRDLGQISSVVESAALASREISSAATMLNSSTGELSHMASELRDVTQHFKR